MATRAQHLQASRRLIGASLYAPPGRVQALGLSPAFLAALQWIATPLGDSGDRGDGLVAGVSENCHETDIPRSVPSPLGGACVPIKVVRGGRASGQFGQLGPIRNAAHPSGSGTIAALARYVSEPSRFLCLTAAHVVAGAAGARYGDKVTIGNGLEGRLVDWEPSLGRGAPRSRMDAAIAELSVDAARELLQGAGNEAPRGVHREFQYGMNLMLRSSRGTRVGHAVCAWSGWLDLSNGGTPYDYWVDDAIGYRTSSPTSGGDSGAAIWTDDERLCGIHCGAVHYSMHGQFNAVAIPIDPVLRRFGLSIIERGVLPNPPVAVPQTLPAPPGEGRAADSDADVLARTLWGEARGEPNPELAMTAVGWVVLNRLRRKTYWGHSIEAVCRKPYQFSCWNAGDPNLAQLQRAAAGTPVFGLACQIAARLISGPAPQDPTGGATHYHSRWMRSPPRWAKGKKPCQVIGNHLFFNDID